MRSDTLGDASTVYSLAKAATQNMTLSQNFGRVDILASLALVLKDIPLENIVMVQYPSTTGVTTPSYYAGKVAPLQAQADALFAAIKSDAPIALDDDSLDGNRNGSTLDPNAPTATATPTAEPTESATATPTTEPVTVSGVKGQSADQYTCAVAN